MPAEKFLNWLSKYFSSDHDVYAILNSDDSPNGFEDYSVTDSVVKVASKGQYLTTMGVDLGDYGIVVSKDDADKGFISVYFYNAGVEVACTEEEIVHDERIGALV